MTDNTDHSHETPTPEDLREQIEGTREELGRTVEDLAAKADVKAQAHAKAGAAKDKAVEVTHEAREKTAHILQSARDKAPEPLREKATEAVTVANQHRGLVIAAAVALACAFLLGRGRGKR